MESLFERLEELKKVLKDQWLDYYQNNFQWINPITNKHRNWYSIPEDEGHRPDAYLILGALNALEPDLQALLTLLVQLNPDKDTLIEVLGLNFDPNIELEKREAERGEMQQAEIVPSLPESDQDAEYLNKIRQENDL